MPFENTPQHPDSLPLVQKTSLLPEPNETRYVDQQPSLEMEPAPLMLAQLAATDTSAPYVQPDGDEGQKRYDDRPRYDIFEKLKKSDAQERTLAQTELVARYGRFVTHQVFVYSRRWPEHLRKNKADSYQSGLIAMLALADAFDPSFNTTFLGYAGRAIITAIGNEYMASAASVKLPAHIYRSRADRHRFIEERQQLGLGQPSVQQIATAIGLTDQRPSDGQPDKSAANSYYTFVRGLALYENMESLDAIHQSDDDGVTGEDISPIEIGSCASIMDTSEDLPVDEQAIKDSGLLAKAIEDRLSKSPLNPRELDILKRTTGLPPYSQRETLKNVAEYHNLSLGRVNQIRHGALSKLQHNKVFADLRDFIVD